MTAAQKNTFAHAVQTYTAAAAICEAIKKFQPSLFIKKGLAMIKRKLKLNSLYGQMVGASLQEEAKAICAAKVRRVRSCVLCLHYKECAKQAMPLSKLARFIAWLDVEALPPLERELQRLCSSNLRLEAHAPNLNEMKEGAYAILRIYYKSNVKHALARLNLTGEETQEELRTIIFNNYARAAKKKLSVKSIKVGVIKWKIKK